MKNTTHLIGLLGLSLLASGCATQTGNNANLGMGVPNQQIYNANQAPQYSSMSHIPQSATTNQQVGLTDLLTRQLGINQNQAMGGVGSIFSLAKQRMSPVDFTQLSQSVPDMNSYLSAVPRTNNNGLLGAAANLAGGNNGTLGTLASLAGTFQSLGMNSNMIGQFMPVVLQYLQEQGGANSMMLLQNALR